MSDVIKVILKVLFYVLILCVVYNIFLPFVKYYIPKDMSLEEYENISGFVIIGIIWVAFVIGKILESSFKKHK